MADVTERFNAGDEITFTVVASDPDGHDISYEWYRNDSIITGETGSTYVTSTHNDGDRFRVEVTDEFDATTESHTITIVHTLEVRINTAESPDQINAYWDPTFRTLQGSDGQVVNTSFNLTAGTDREFTATTQADVTLSSGLTLRDDITNPRLLNGNLRYYVTHTLSDSSSVETITCTRAEPPLSVSSRNAFNDTTAIAWGRNIADRIVTRAVDSNVDWTITKPSWVSGPSSGTGSQSVRFNTSSTNATGRERSGTITLSATDTSLGLSDSTISVTQTGSANPTLTDVSEDAGTVSFTETSSGSKVYRTSVNSADAWELTFTGNNDAGAAEPFYYSISGSNTETTTTSTTTGQFSTTGTTINFEDAGGVGAGTVTIDAYYGDPSDDGVLTGEQIVVHVTFTSATQVGALPDSLSVRSNDFPTNGDQTLDFNAEGNITTSGNSTPIIVVDTRAVTGGSQSPTWGYASTTQPPSWATLTPSSGGANGTDVTVSVPSHNEERTGQVVFEDSNGAQEVVILRQNYVDPDSSRLSPLTVERGYSGSEFDGNIGFQVVAGSSVSWTLQITSDDGFLDTPMSTGSSPTATTSGTGTTNLTMTYDGYTGTTNNRIGYVRLNVGGETVSSLVVTQTPAPTGAGNIGLRSIVQNGVPVNVTAHATENNRWSVGLDSSVGYTMNFNGTNGTQYTTNSGTIDPTSDSDNGTVVGNGFSLTFEDSGDPAATGYTNIVYPGTTIRIDQTFGGTTSGGSSNPGNSGGGSGTSSTSGGGGGSGTNAPITGTVAIDATDAFTTAGEAVTLDADTTGVTNPDSVTLAYAWSVTSGPGSITAGANSARATMTVNSDATESSADVVVSLDVDGTENENLTASRTIRNDIVDNQTPTAAITGSTTGNTGSTGVTLSGTGSTDPDNDLLTFTWRIVSGSGSLSSTTGSSTTVTATSAGSVRVGLIVNDGTVDSTEVTHTITFSVPTPTISVTITGATQVYTGETTPISATVTTSDSSTPTFTYNWSDISGSSNSLARNVGPGTYTLTVSASGYISGSDSHTVSDRGSRPVTYSYSYENDGNVRYFNSAGSSTGSSIEVTNSGTCNAPTSGGSCGVTAQTCTTSGTRTETYNRNRSEISQTQVCRRSDTNGVVSNSLCGGSPQQRWVAGVSLATGLTRNVSCSGSYSNPGYLPPFTSSSVRASCSGTIPQAGVTASQASSYLSAGTSGGTISATSSVGANSSTSSRSVSVGWSWTGRIPSGFQEAGETTTVTGTVSCTQAGMPSNSAPTISTNGQVNGVSYPSGSTVTVTSGYTITAPTFAGSPTPSVTNNGNGAGSFSLPPGGRGRLHRFTATNSEGDVQWRVTVQNAN